MTEGGTKSGQRRRRSIRPSRANGDAVALVVNRLSEVLAEKEWTVTDLAEIANLPYGTLRRIMRRNSNPPLDVAVVLSRTLDVPLEQLFSLEVEARSAQRRPLRARVGPRKAR